METTRGLTASDVETALLGVGIRPMTIAQFIKFHRANPTVWEEFERLALSAIRSGVRRWSAKGIAEVVRWTFAVEQRSSVYKVNNNYVAYYARCFALKYPEYEGFFEFREVKGLAA